MKKIGIMTFHRAKNYGAMLQSYALQETLNKKFDTYLVDYRCPEIEEKYYVKKTLVRKIKNFLKLFFQTEYILSVNKKNRRFNEFVNNFLKTSKPYYAQNIAEANNEFDAFIAGSDQIWNMKWSGTDWNYFLEFADSNKKFSYAVGLGNSIDEAYKMRILKDVESFQAILTREEDGRRLLKSIGVKKEIGTVCDPVFLLGKKEWTEKLALEQIEKKRKKYLLLYFVAKPTDAIPFAKKIAEQDDLEIVYVNINAEKNIPSDFTDVIGIGPREFLGLIKNAEVVITTSFHAMAFSLIFNKNFYYELCKDGSNNNSRLENLANICDVTDREILTSYPTRENEINWDAVNNSINCYAKDSLRVLLDKIENAMGEYDDKQRN